MTKYLYAFWISIIIISCNSQNSMIKAIDMDADTTIVVDITGLYSDSVRKYVDDYIDEMELVFLETNDSSIVYGVDEVVASSSYIYIRDAYRGGGVAIFDREGRFVRRLANGEAPFEIGKAGSIFYDNNSGLFYVYDKLSGKIMKYSSDGLLISYHYCEDLPLGISVKGDKIFMADIVLRDEQSFFDVVETDTALNKMQRLSLGELNVRKEGLNRFFHTYYDGITINNPWNYNIVNYVQGKWKKYILQDDNSHELKSQLRDEQVVFKGICYHSCDWWIYRFVGNSFGRSMFWNEKTGDKWFAKSVPHSFYNLIILYGVEDSDEQKLLGIVDVDYMVNGSQNPDFVWNGSNLNGLLSDKDIAKLRKVILDDNPIIVFFKLK